MVEALVKLNLKSIRLWVSAFSYLNLLNNLVNLSPQNILP